MTTQQPTVAITERERIAIEVLERIVADKKTASRWMFSMGVVTLAEDALARIQAARDGQSQVDCLAQGGEDGVERLKEIRSVLDKQCGDSDPIDDLTDDELRDMSPLFWCCMQLSKLIDAAPAREALQQSKNDCDLREGEKRWPLVESPGEFTERLRVAMQEFPLIGAVRNVLIENPPTLAAPAPRAEVEDARDAARYRAFLSALVRMSPDQPRVWVQWVGGDGKPDTFGGPGDDERMERILDAAVSRAASPAQAPQRFAPSEAGGEGK